MGFKKICLKSLVVRFLPFGSPLEHAKTSIFLNILGSGMGLVLVCCLLIDCVQELTKVMLLVVIGKLTLMSLIDFCSNDWGNISKVLPSSSTYEEICMHWLV